MKHCYRNIVAYNPSDNVVTSCLKMSENSLFDSKASDEAFYDVFLSVDRVTNIIIGVSLTGDMYQLSPAAYGTYIKEDSRSMEYLNKARILVAIAKYKKEHNLW